MKRYLTIVLLLLIAVFTQNATIEGQEAFFQPALQPSDIESNLGIDWYGVYLQGRKIGWCRNALTRAGDNIADSLVLREDCRARNQERDRLRPGEVFREQTALSTRVRRSTAVRRLCDHHR